MIGASKHVTLQVIADELGLTPSTVSRVLNSPSQSAARRWASAETIDRVRSYAAEHGYSPNPQAVGLRTQRTQLIGVVVPRLQDYVLATVYEGVDEAATELGYTTCVANSLDDPDKQALATETLLSRRVDGLIFGDARHDGEFLRLVEESGTKFVLVSRRVPGFPSVTCDDIAGGRLVGEHLLATGRRDVAILAGQPFASTGIDRTRGVVEAFAEAGIEIPAHRIVHGPFDAPGGRTATDRLLDQGPPPDAIFAVNDFAAIGAMGVLRDRYLSVPGDIALVGYNDTPLASELPVSLTTVRSPMRQMGRQGMLMLLRILRGEPGEELRLPPELVVRESTGAARY